MRLSRLFLLAVPFAVLALATTGAQADDTKAFLDPANWEGRSDLFKIEKGTIIGETTEDPKYNTFFCSKKKYGDFELRFKVKMRDGVGNSGVQVRSELYDKEKFRVRGPQADTAKGYWGAIYGEGVGGYLLKSKVDNVGKDAEANDYIIVVKGNHITITVNGKVAQDVDFPESKDKKPALAQGIIAFQVHGGYPKMRVEFSDIQFTELKK